MISYWSSSLCIIRTLDVVMVFLTLHHSYSRRGQTIQGQLNIGIEANYELKSRTEFGHSVPNLRNGLYFYLSSRPTHVTNMLTEPVETVTEPRMTERNLERPNLERPNVERPNIERPNIEKDRTSKDRTSNGTEPRKTERRMGPNVERLNVERPNLEWDRTSKD